MSATNRIPPTDTTLTTAITALLTPLGGRTAIAAHRTPIATPPRALPLLSQRPPDDDADDHHAHDRAPAIHGRELDAVLLREHDIVPAASLSKICIAIELFRRADLGQFDLDERLDTSTEPRVGGGGVLDYLHPDTRLTLNDLCFLMLGVSDNTAANFLLDLLGIGEINETLSRLNLEHTRLARHFMDWEARANHRDNLTTAADIATLLLLIRGNALPGARRLRDLLAAQQCADDIAAWLPDTAQLAHKTGSLADTFHDAGILTGPSGACVFCVLTTAQPDPPAARAAVGHTIRLLWDAWCA